MTYNEGGKQIEKEDKIRTSREKEEKNTFRRRLLWMLILLSPLSRNGKKGITVRDVGTHSVGMFTCGHSGRVRVRVS